MQGQRAAESRTCWKLSASRLLRPPAPLGCLACQPSKTLTALRCAGRSWHSCQQKLHRPLLQLHDGRAARLQAIFPRVQVCEVHVQLSHCRASTVHTISALLAPDGSRNHKLNGKNKTGKEVKASSHVACRIGAVLYHLLRAVRYKCSKADLARALCRIAQTWRP